MTVGSLASGLGLSGRGGLRTGAEARRRPGFPGLSVTRRARSTGPRTADPGRAAGQPAAACPRCAQPVIRRSSTAKNTYITIAIAPITNSPANTSGMRIDEPAAIIR